MKRIKDIIVMGEDWLLARIIDLAHDKGYTRYSSTLEEAWRIMIKGISEPLIQYLDSKGSLDLIASEFVAKQAHAHQIRGVSIADFTGLLKCCRRGYLELALKSELTREDRDKAKGVINKYFDYLEMESITRMTKPSKDSLLDQLRKRNRELTNEKNQFLTIFESISNPVVYINIDNQVSWMNQAFREFANNIGDKTISYYEEGDYVDAPSWLESISLELKTSKQSTKKYQTDFDTNMGYRNFEIKLSKMVDISGKFTGTIAILSDLTEYLRAKNKLKETYSRLEQLFRSVPDGLVFISSDYRILNANERLASWFGLQPSDMIGDKCHKYFKSDYCNQTDCVMKHINGSSSIVDREGILELNKEDKRNVLVTSAPLFDTKGEFTGIVESIKDITGRKRAEEGLKNYRELFLRARDIIVFIRMDGQILDANKSALEAYGYTYEEIIRKNINDLRLPGSEKSHHQQMIQAYENGIEVKTTHLRKDGSIFPVEVSASGIDIGGEKVVVSIIRDITDRVKYEEKIYYFGFHDKLTGLYNRAYFEEKLKQVRAEEIPYSIIMGDLNGLKITNDGFGHKTGDMLLIETGEILRKSCQSGDTVARIGGDEFAILLPGANEKAALAVIERIRENCRNSPIKPMRPSISLGVSTKTHKEQNIFEVFRDAETKMYRRKILEADSARSFSITSLQRVLHENSFETEAHTERVRSLVGLIGRELKVSGTLLDDLDLFATLHDIGKTAIPSEIVRKPSKLTEEEWVIMKQHPEIGYRIARACRELAPIAEYILFHHERWDGGGYPRGLSGEEIPLAARILAVADAFDVMVNERPYKPAFTLEQAVKELKDNSGSQFDPKVVNAFLAILKKDKDSILE